MARRFRGRNVQRSQRRRTDWSAFFDERFSLGTTAVQLGGTVFTTALGTSTLARIHGYISASLVSVTSALDGFRGAIGIGKVQDEAFTAGVGSVPSPITEVDWDGWLMHHFFEIRAASGTETDSWVGNPYATYQKEIDVKSMRKIDEQEDFIVVMEAIEIGTAVGELSIQCRSLELLP